MSIGRVHFKESECNQRCLLLLPFEIETDKVQAVQILNQQIKHYVFFYGLPLIHNHQHLSWQTTTISLPHLDSAWICIFIELKNHPPWFSFLSTFLSYPSVSVTLLIYLFPTNYINQQQTTTLKVSPRWEFQKPEMLCQTTHHSYSGTLQLKMR